MQKLIYLIEKMSEMRKSFAKILSIRDSTHC